MLAKPLELHPAVVVLPKSFNQTEKNAVQVLLEAVYKRTKIQLIPQNHWPETTKNVIALATEKHEPDFPDKISEQLRATATPENEGFRLLSRENAVILWGKDSRGLLYAVGKFLRMAELRQNSIQFPRKVKISSTPQSAIRGHQLGYRPKTNAYDAWGVAQFEQYIRELALFGANSIEILPPRTDDDALSRHMKVEPMQMMIELSRIIDRYGLDVWIWYPNMGTNYTHPDSIEMELAEREAIFRKLPRIDVVFVPGGDPGDLHPDLLFAWLEKVGNLLRKYHPEATIWVSPQAFRPTREWLSAFYTNVNRKPTWFGGVVFGPWVKDSLPAIRRKVHPEIPIRRYPDITHSLSSQYPVPQWDLAFAMTLGRECINPRPLAEKHIHNLLKDFANGSISYSEGTNDDVNKFIWSAQDWDPTTPAIETLREYACLFISPDLTEGVARGLLALEENLSGPLLANTQVERTLKQWQSMAVNAPEPVLANYRFQMGLLRANFDALIQRRLRHETWKEQQVLEVLENAQALGSLTALDTAEKIIEEMQAEPVGFELRQRCFDLADSLYHSIGAQLTVEKHGAAPGRGDFIDSIDKPLNNAPWLREQINLVRQLKTEPERLAAIKKVLERENPGPGGFYDNFGTPRSWAPVKAGDNRATDPGSLHSPRVSFGVGLVGEEWVHTIDAKGFAGQVTPLAWMNQITTLYDTPLTLIYERLNPAIRYRLRVAYTGRFRSRMKLVANGEFVIHDFLQTGTEPLFEFDIPAAITADGTLTLTWTCGEGERGSQVAELWLIPLP